MAKPKIEVGQTIWVHRKQLYGIRDLNGTLEEFKVARINSTSVYLESQKKNGKLELRLNRKDLSHRDGFLYSYQGYLDPEDYSRPIREEKEKNALIEYINSRLKQKNMVELEKIKNYIDSGE